MRREELFFDAITNIRENLVEEAQNYAFRRRVRWHRWAGLAACLVLAVFLSLPLLLPNSGSDSNATSADRENTAAPSGGQAAPGNSDGAVSGETAPQAPSQDPAGDGGNNEAVDDLLIFNATVREVREKTLLVEPDQGTGIAVQVIVPIEDFPSLPALQAGDRVTVTASGPILETEPAQIMGVTDVALLAE